MRTKTKRQQVKSTVIFNTYSRVDPIVLANVHSKWLPCIPQSLFATKQLNLSSGKY